MLFRSRADLPGLSGEALRRQQDRVNELVAVATWQNKTYLKGHIAAGVSGAVHSAGGASKGQASSPHVGGSRDRSVNSGGNKQMQTYDPALAGKQLVVQGSMGRGKSYPGAGNPEAGRGNSAGRGYPPRYPVQSQPRQQQSVGHLDRKSVV